MSITNPSIGEYLDRLSILRLKIHHGELGRRPIDHFRQEQKEILARLPETVSLHGPLVEELFFINEALWEMTDEFRASLHESQESVQARFGRLILRMNDRRASVIAKISAAHGDFRLEKINA